MGLIIGTENRQVASPPPPRTDTLRSGESLSSFAARHHVTVQSVREANPRVFTNIDEIQQGVAVDQTRLLQDEALVVPAPVMSVGDDPLTSDFNPGYGTSADVYGVDVDAGNSSGGVTWTPDEGKIEIRAGEVFSTDEPGSTAQSPVTFEARQDTAVALGVRNQDGNTIVTVEADVGSSASVSAEAGRAEAEVGTGAGVRSRYEVVLPGEDRNPANALLVNPFDPTTIPVGGSVTMHGAAYVDTELAGSFRHIGTRTSVTEAAGASYTVSRPSEIAVRVTMGPDYAIEAFNGVGLRFEDAELMVGRQDDLGSTTLQTAEFDLSSSSGQAAYANFVATGDVAAGTGTSNVATIERLDYSSQTRLEAELGPLSASLGGQQNVGSAVRTTYPDDSFAITTGLQYSENVPLVTTQRFDAAGNEIVSERTYQFTVNTDRPSYGWWQRNVEGRNEASEELDMAQMLNTALTGDVSGNGPVQPREEVTLTFSESQMTAFLSQTRAAAATNEGGGDTLALLTGGEDGKTVNSNFDFAVAVARNLGGDPYGFSARMLEISIAADGDYRNGVDRIDATAS